MPDPVTLSAGISWGVSAAGWLISPVVSRLVNKCFDALGQDHDQRKSLDDKLRDLQTTLLPQLIILTDAAQRSPHRRQLEDWLQKLKSAYYEVEDLHGLVEYTQLEKKANTSFPTKSRVNFWYNSKLNDIVLNNRKKDLLKSLEKFEKIVDKDASKLVAMLNLSTNSVSNSNPRPNEKHSEHSNETISVFGGLKVIGRDKDREQIKNLLRMETPRSSEYNAKCYSVIGIWGIGGSGKTTLAQYVCEYERKNSKYFDLVMWAHVSQNFSVETIYKRILESLHEHPEYDSKEGLQSQLQKKLKGQRFLLVLDDAWCDEGVSEEKFQQLFAPLQEAQRGSKILVTTRIEGAAKALGARDLIPLRQLEHDEFLKLFMAHALRDLRDAEKHLKGTLKQIGEQIAAKLHRSPLAATTVAAQLCIRRDPDFWLSMCEQNLLNETMGALLLSYQNLPPHLQRCFAFCSLFPKGYKFSQDRLVGLWIGEDFIETEDSNRHVRDIGNEYMLELISSSFLQVDKDIFGDTEYSLHDLLHDLAEKVSNCDCFRIECNEKRDIPIHTRHLYVEADMFGEYIEKICKLKDLRTILFGSWGTLKEEDLNALFKRSKKLYVVDLFDCFIDGWPKNVLRLKNLRYLNYGASDVTKFSKPSTGFYQLRLLRDEDGRGYSNIQIPNVGRLTLLQDLTVFRVRDVRGCGLEQLEHLRDLYGELVICNLKNVNNSQEACRVKLFDKKGLRALELCWTDVDSSDSYICNPNEIEDAEDILDALCPPPQLEKLRIKSYRGKRCPKWFSGYNKNATHIKELCLDDCPFLEALPETNNLIHLQSLAIEWLPRLKTWASLPSNLVNLTLHFCRSLAFLLEEDLKVIMSTHSGDEPSPIHRELEKLVPDYIWRNLIKRLEELDRMCQLKEVNRELHLPLTLQELKMASCFISDQALASSLKGHTSLTHLELHDIIPITCIPREVLSSQTNLRVLRITWCSMLTSVDGLNTLSSLEVLEIKECPCLTIESLDLSNSKLRELKIEECPCLTIESLDMSNSKSLSSLSLRRCTNLVSLMGLNELNNLKDLSIVGCDKLQCSSDANKLPGVRGYLTISKLSIMLELVSRDGLSSLVSLTIENAEQEYFTPEECEMLSHLSSLEEIQFESCKMQSLPDLSCLKSLTRLAIWSCKDLTSLSSLPPSVRAIYISFCNAEFVRSCKDSNHPNCQKISHIPEKHISEGFYWNSSNQMNDG